MQTARNELPPILGRFVPEDLLINPHDPVQLQAWWLLSEAAPALSHTKSSKHLCGEDATLCLVGLSEARLPDLLERAHLQLMMHELPGVAAGTADLLRHILAALASSFACKEVLAEVRASVVTDRRLRSRG